MAQLAGKTILTTSITSAVYHSLYILSMSAAAVVAFLLVSPCLLMSS